MAEGWSVMQGEGDDRHVVPNFGRPHDLTTECWCTPRRDVEDQTVVVHWSHEAVASFPRKDDGHG